MKRHGNVLIPPFPISRKMNRMANMPIEASTRRYRPDYSNLPRLHAVDVHSGSVWFVNKDAAHEPVKKTTGKAKVNTNVRGSRKKSFNSTQVSFNSDFMFLLDDTPAGDFDEKRLQRGLSLTAVQRHNPMFHQFSRD